MIGTTTPLYNKVKIKDSAKRTFHFTQLVLGDMNIKPLIILTIVSLFAIGLCAYLQLRLEIALTERDQAIQYSLSKDDTLEYLTTKLGQVTSRSRVQDLTIRNLERLQADKELRWLKHIEGINKRMNNVEQIMTTTARVVGSFNIPLRDTSISLQDGTGLTSGRIFDNKYEWFHLKGIILEDSLLVTPDVPVPLQSVLYWQRELWPKIRTKKGTEGEKDKFIGLRIGKKEWFKQTTSINPYVRITEDKLIRVSKRKPK